MNKTTVMGLWDSTITMFFTDNGDFLGDYDSIEKWPSGVSENLLHDPADHVENTLLGIRSQNGMEAGGHISWELTPEDQAESNDGMLGCFRWHRFPLDTR